MRRRSRLPGSMVRSKPSYAVRVTSPRSANGSVGEKAATARIAEDIMATATFDMNDLKRRMQGAIASLKQELGGLRTGRASSALLDHVQVEAYGGHMPLNQLATISVPEPRLLNVQVWDRSMVHPVEKAISAANL